MPNYDYKCKDCGNIFEVFHSMSENPEIVCPVCGAKAQKKIGAGAGIVFKGNGFYVTDYKNKKNDEKKKPDQKSSQKEKKSEKSTPKSDGKKAS